MSASKSVLVVDGMHRMGIRQQTENLRTAVKSENACRAVILTAGIALPTTRCRPLAVTPPAEVLPAAVRWMDGRCVVTHSSAVGA